jgi:hypothetical protein
MYGVLHDEWVESMLCSTSEKARICTFCSRVRSWLGSRREVTAELDNMQVEGFSAQLFAELPDDYNF